MSGMADCRGAVALVPAAMAVRESVAQVMSINAVAVPAVDHVMDAL